MTEQEKQDWYALLTARANAEGTYGVAEGMRITAVGDGWAQGELLVEKGHHNPAGIVHGGVYCTMMDQVAGAAACTSGALCRTVSCDVRFLEAAQSGRLISHAEAVRMGRSITVMRAWVEDDGGMVCAEGVYTFRMKPLEKPVT